MSEGGRELSGPSGTSRVTFERGSWRALLVPEGPREPSYGLVPSVEGPQVPAVIFAMAALKNVVSRV